MCSYIGDFNWKQENETTIDYWLGKGMTRFDTSVVEVNLLGYALSYGCGYHQLNFIISRSD